MTAQKSIAALCAVAALTLGAGGAWAHPSAMMTGSLTSQPIGHYEFCKRNASECSIRSRDVTPLKMSMDLLGRLEKLTVTVNQAIKPKSDLDLYGKEEFWTYPVEAMSHKPEHGRTGPCGGSIRCRWLQRSIPPWPGGDDGGCREQSVVSGAGRKGCERRRRSR